jgi:hypothetical protein
LRPFFVRRYFEVLPPAVAAEGDEEQGAEDQVEEEGGDDRGEEQAARGVVGGEDDKDEISAGAAVIAGVSFVGDEELPAKHAAGAIDDAKASVRLDVAPSPTSMADCPSLGVVELSEA